MDTNNHSLPQSQQLTQARGIQGGRDQNEYKLTAR